MDTGRIYTLLTFLAETERSDTCYYVGLLNTAVTGWCAHLSIAPELLRSAPFMVLRQCPHSGREVYYGVDFDEALNWLHSIGIVDTEERGSLLAQKTLELMESD